jgi:hypothetical protein
LATAQPQPSPQGVWIARDTSNAPHQDLQRPAVKRSQHLAQPAFIERQLLNNLEAADRRGQSIAG